MTRVFGPWSFDPAAAAAVSSRQHLGLRAALTACWSLCIRLLQGRLGSKPNGGIRLGTGAYTLASLMSNKDRYSAVTLAEVPLFYQKWSGWTDKLNKESIF